MTATEMILGALTALGTIFTAFAIPLFKKYLYPFLESKLTIARMEELCNLAEIAIRYFESNITESKSGSEKKEKVLGYLHNEGYDITEEIDMFIDAKVNQLNSTDWR